MPHLLLVVACGAVPVSGAIACFVLMRFLKRKRAELHEKVQQLTLLQRRADLFVSTVDALPIAIVVSSQDGSTFANRKARDAGYSPAESATDPRSWEMKDRDGNRLRREDWPLQRARERGDQVSSEPVQIVRTDGEMSWLEASAQPVHGTGPQPLGAMMVLVDVTESRKLERRQVLLSRASSLATSADHELQISQVLASLFVPELADWCTVDVLDEHGDKIVRAGAAHSDPSEKRALMARGPVERWRKDEPIDTDLNESVLKVRCPPGPVVANESNPARSVAVPLRGRRGVVGVLTLGISGFGRRFDNEQFRLAQDVARHAALAIENMTLLRQAREASRAKDEFLAILGHELRNPLAPISAALSLIERKGYAGLEKEYTVIRRQVLHMRRLVDDLLDVTRIARGTMDLKFEVLDLADVVADGIELVSPALEKKCLRLELDVEHQRFFLRGDRTRLAQVVANLLGNAAKWSEPAQAIDIVARADHHGVALSVRDVGAGMTADLLPRIFDLFAQAPQARDRAAGGLGIGLALVKTIVGLHKGAVTAMSEGLGHGSTFTVLLPTVAAEAAVAGTAAVPWQMKGNDGEKVLVVDDNVDAADSLGDILRSEGFDVRVVHDASEALRIIGEFRPRVALLDLGLPAMDGYELASRLRECVPGIRLIAVTGYAQESDRITARLRGFEHHFAKPVDWNVLKSAIQGHGLADASRMSERSSQ